MNWIEGIVEAYADNEAPQRFFYWSALIAISSVVRKNVYLDRFHYKLYPNLYAFLIAKSGMKKGIPIWLAKSLTAKTQETRVVSGRNSMPRIVQDLGKVFTTDSGTRIKEAQALLVSGELAAFLVKDPDALTILTDLHNTHEYEDYWTNSLKGTGVDKLLSPCISLFGASNESLLDQIVTTRDVEGGFVARTFIVMSEEPVTPNSLVDPPKNIPDTTELAKYLKNLSRLKGAFTWNRKTKDMYDKWYKEIMSFNVHDPTGTINRIGDKVLKIAMVVSLGESESLILEEKHIFEGITVAVDCFNSAKQLTMGAGKSPLSSQTRLLMRELIQNTEHKVTRKAFLAKYWGNVDSFELDRIAETLLSAGAIEVSYPGKATCVYSLKKDVLDRYTGFVRGVQ